MKPNKVAVIGVPMDFGASKAGCAGGPDAIRRTGLLADIKKLGHDVEDYGNIPVPPRDKADRGSYKKKYQGAIVSACKKLADEVGAGFRAGRTPIVLGGDHSLALGSITGAAAHFRKKDKRIGLIWVDAHGDMNTPATSRSGNIHGMPLAALLGLGDRKLAGFGGFEKKVRAENICLIGVRDLDEEEKELIRGSGVHVYTMKQIDIRGLAKVVSEAIGLASEGTVGFHLSFDIDAIDPSIASGTGTLSRGGLTYRESHLLCELVSDSKKMLSMDLVEVNPLEDTRNNTAELAGELIQSALGKTIY